MVLRCFSAPDEKVNLCFYPCGSGTGPGDRDTYCQEPLRIYKTDYTMLLLPYLESEFPEFDVCRGRDLECHNTENRSRHEPHPFRRYCL